MITCDYTQGSEEWLQARAGKITASEFKNLFTSTGKATTGQTRQKYLYKLAAERICGEPEETFSNGWMERGNQLESEAREFFEQQTGFFVAQVGMVLLRDNRSISCSPDGLILQDAGLEIKCPKPSTHISYLEREKLPSAYKSQVQGSMWVTGRQTWWFMSYCPGIAPLIIKVKRDDDYIDKLAHEIRGCNEVIEEIVKRHSTI